MNGEEVVAVVEVVNVDDNQVEFDDEMAYHGQALVVMNQSYYGDDQLVANDGKLFKILKVK